MVQVHISNFDGVAGSEDFACATLPITPLDFQGKVQKFLSPYPPKNQIYDKCRPQHPLLEKGQSQNYGALINDNGLLTPQVLVTHDNLFHQGEPFQ